MQQCAAITEPLFAFDTTDPRKLFFTGGRACWNTETGAWKPCSWESIERRIAPALAEAKERRAQQQREQERRDILKQCRRSAS